MSDNEEKGDDYYDLSPEETSDPDWLEKLLGLNQDNKRGEE